MSINISRTAAIKLARNQITTLTASGGSWTYSYRDEVCNAWRRSKPSGYWAALSQRAQLLVDVARQAQGLGLVHYSGGSWTDYV